MRFEWFSTKWTGLPDQDTFAALSRDPLPDSPLQPPISRRDEAYRIWASQPLPRRSFPARVSITMPNGNKPPPFYVGALSHKSRRISSACLQLTNRHCFDATYSMRFRPTAGDEIACPCNFSVGTTTPLRGHSDGSAVEGRPTRGRTATEAGSQRNASFEELQRRYEDPLDDGTDLPATVKTESAPGARAGEAVLCTIQSNTFSRNAPSPPSVEPNSYATCLSQPSLVLKTAASA